MDTDTSVTRADELVARIAQIEKNTEETLKAVKALAWGSQHQILSTMLMLSFGGLENITRRLSRASIFAQNTISHNTQRTTQHTTHTTHNKTHKIQ